MKNIPVRRIKNTDEEANFSEGFNIRRLADLLSGKEMIQNLHRHDFFFVLAVEKGKGEHNIDFISHAIRDHVVFFLRPGQVHELLLKRGSTGFLIEFGAHFYSPRGKPAHQMLRKISSKNIYRFNKRSFDKLKLILNHILEEHGSKQGGFKEVIHANLEILFIELFRQNEGASNRLDHNSQYAQERLDEFLALLETNFANWKQVAQYADRLSLTPYQLNSITKTILGKTCSQLINEQLILEAKRLLLATPAQVNQIGPHLGYEDVSYFIRFFRKHTGLSPDVFRKKYR